MEDGNIASLPLRGISCLPMRSTRADHMPSIVQPFCSAASAIERVTCTRSIRSGIKSRAFPLVWVPRAGHNSNVDNPEFVNNQIEQFLRSIDEENI